MKKTTKKIVYISLYLCFVAGCSILLYLLIADPKPKKQEKKPIPVITTG